MLSPRRPVLAPRAKRETPDLLFDGRSPLLDPVGHLADPVALAEEAERRGLLGDNNDINNNNKSEYNNNNKKIRIRLAQMEYNDNDNSRRYRALVCWISRNKVAQS